MSVDWPALRVEYDGYDSAYQSLLRSWFRDQR
jgi:hypothetical protein